MIRWSYVLPRLIIVSAVLLTFCFGTDAFLRWLLIRSGQAAVGAKVELEQVETSLRGGRMRLAGLQIANPSAPLKNLVEAAEMQVVLDMPALLHRQFVVREGRVTGLKFAGDRTTSGKLAEAPKAEPRDNEALRREALRWLEQLGSLLNEQVINEFESVQVAREVGERWPKEYDALAAEADQFKQRVQALRDAVRQAKQRPLENMDAVQRAIQEAAGLRDHVQYFHQRLGQLQHQVLQDKESIEYARRRDVGRIEEALRLDVLDSDALSDYFLGPEVAPYFDTVLSWTRWAKQWLDVAGDPPRPERTRGSVIEFPRYGTTPDLLIERLLVQGEARLDGKALPFEGQLTGVTSDPKRYGQPARLDIALAGQHPARLQVTLDGTGEQLVQRLTFDCREIKIAPRALGKSDVFTLAVPATKAHLWVEMTLRDDQLKGRLVWKQAGVKLKPDVGGRYGGERVANRLRSALGGIDHVDAVVKLSGPIRKPRLKLKTSLGEELTRGLELAAREELSAQRDALVMRANLEIAEELTRLDGKLARKKQKVVSYLQVGEQLMGELQQFTASIVPVNTDVLNHPLLRRGKAAALPSVPDLKKLDTILR